MHRQTQSAPPLSLLAKGPKFFRERTHQTRICLRMRARTPVLLGVAAGTFRAERNPQQNFDQRDRDDPVRSAQPQGRGGRWFVQKRFNKRVMARRVVAIRSRRNTVGIDSPRIPELVPPSINTHSSIMHPDNARIHCAIINYAPGHHPQSKPGASGP